MSFNDYLRQGREERLEDYFGKEIVKGLNPRELDSLIMSVQGEEIVIYQQVNGEVQIENRTPDGVRKYHNSLVAKIKEEYKKYREEKVRPRIEAQLGTLFDSALKAGKISESSGKINLNMGFRKVELPWVIDYFKNNGWDVQQIEEVNRRLDVITNSYTLYSEYHLFFTKS